MRDSPFHATLDMLTDGSVNNLASCATDVCEKSTLLKFIKMLH